MDGSFHIIPLPSYYCQSLNFSVCYHCSSPLVPVILLSLLTLLLSSSTHQLPSKRLFKQASKPVLFAEPTPMHVYDPYQNFVLQLHFVAAVHAGEARPWWDLGKEYVLSHSNCDLRVPSLRTLRPLCCSFCIHSMRLTAVGVEKWCCPMGVLPCKSTKFQPIKNYCMLWTLHHFVSVSENHVL